MNDETITFRRRRRQHQLLFFRLQLILINVTIAATNIVFFCLSRSFLYFDSQRDFKYIKELLFYRSSSRIFHTLRMKRKIFKLLIDWTKKNTNLRSSRRDMTLKKQLNIFLFIVEQNFEYRLIAEIWVKSLNIIEHVFHRVLTILFKLYTIFVIFVTNDTRHDIKKRRNMKFWF